MLLFLLLTLFTIATIVFGHMWEKKHYLSTSSIGMVASVLGIFSGIILVIVLVVALCINLTESEDYVIAMAEYEGLNYIVENVDDNYLDDFDIRKADIVNKVYDWNVKVTKNQQYCDNIWVGMFTQDFWKEIPLIDYERLNRS